MDNLILVTGGAGFIGSHTCVALSAAGYRPLILDNLNNSDVRVLERLAKITGRPPSFIKGDVRDRTLLDRIFREHNISGVMHFAGLKAVGDSVTDPILYYGNNVTGALVLAEAMQAAAVKTLIFSSSATVYGTPERSPIPESAPCRPANPYGRSKRMVEQMLADLQHSQPDWRISLLRYFNPVGAHQSGLIGEHPLGNPNNLMPLVSQVAVGVRDQLAVHGNDYPTHDGTGIRDYVHVMDLAEGHVAALRHAASGPGLVTLNLSTGQGASVLDVVKAFERASGQRIAYEVGPRRPGDVAAYWGDPSLAQVTLGWRARRGMDQMCADTWRWQQQNPQGYESDGAL
ncbi:UDP-glucose 4-epimerase GalE [Variovorax sp. dw_308]|uniref:UDP-glucose 4-epimerase GalE n=1 Tax=Variovorax sp. dw_308 TaxID=2721546 RepID=UPI001C48D4A2|nr:UDP-glucose 4-epimerase GalE [Variovorax sp. dw_308]